MRNGTIEQVSQISQKGMANNTRDDSKNIHILGDPLSAFSSVVKPRRDMFHYLSMWNRSSSSPVTTGLLSGLNGVLQLFPLVFRLAVTLPGPTGGRTAVTLVYCARDASDSKPATT